MGNICQKIAGKRHFGVITKIGAVVAVVMLCCCSPVRHVPKDRLLLDKVSIHIDDSAKVLKTDEMINYVRQLPNHKILWCAKLQLGIYNMSGKDTTRWWNRWVRRLGEPPVIYDPALADASQRQLRQAMINKGYMNAEVKVDTISNRGKQKMRVGYTLIPGTPHTVEEISYTFANDSIATLVMEADRLLPLRKGDRLDRDILESERDVITSVLRNNGYYGFSKEFVTFVADTLLGDLGTAITVTVNKPYDKSVKPSPVNTHTPYRIANIYVLTDSGVIPSKDDTEAPHDTVTYRDIDIIYGDSRYLRPSVIYDNTYIRKDSLYRQTDVERTYKAFSQLGILKFSDIRFVPTGDDMLDAYILLTPDKAQSVSIEAEGTNSAGDLGMAVGITYTHKNIAKGSETFTTKLRGAYEAISGNFNGLIHNRYMEYSVESGINFPKFKAPLLKESFKRKIKATTELNISLNYQERPEYSRIIAAAGWSYRWAERATRNRHIFTPIDINYVYLPTSTNDFLDQIAPDNPLLRYSYEDHFIMRMGYNFYYSTKRQPSPWNRDIQTNVSTVRVNAEIAGNLLFALSSIFHHRSNFHEDPYKVFGIRYSQYFKVEADYSFLHQFDTRNSIAFHAGAGVGVPYGNSTILPFEKRFYGGGANGVRGWAVRTLGPGSFRGSNSVTDFIHQCGDIRLDLNAEYRAKLFWVIELGVFVDAGNIWTIRNYPTQPGGVFLFDRFYKQIAAAYGIGIRMDFNYFLIRFDLGMKAHNPAQGEEPWPLIHPNWHRDNSFHFSIGYPF